MKSRKISGICLLFTAVAVLAFAPSASAQCKSGGGTCSTSDKYVVQVVPCGDIGCGGGSFYIVTPYGYGILYQFWYPIHVTGYCCGDPVCANDYPVNGCIY
jgi:hypothetical protein